MYFSVATEPGSDSTPNEDWVGISPTVVVVLDGVTVPDAEDVSCRHGTPWYVGQLGMQLIANATDPTVSLSSALERAIETVAGRHADVCDLSQIGAPSAAVAAVRLRERAIDYLVLADATILLDLNTRLDVITDDRVHGTVSDLEGQENIGAQIMERRKRNRNRKGGYWVAAADPAAAAEAFTGRVPRTEFRHAVLMTDGAARLVTPFKQTDWGGLLNLSLDSGALSVVRHVRAIESDDSFGRRWPRFKAHDDASIAIIDAERLSVNSEWARGPRGSAGE